jgi:hypothetical protein
MQIYEWMSGLDKDRKLYELCLPGSHDAGVYRDLDHGVKPGSKAQCQYSGIYEQAMEGSRVFDIRCFLRTKGVIKKTKTVTMGHFFKEAKDGYLGDYGGTLMAALEDAAFFLSSRPTEFIIFRIGHTKCTGDVAAALKQFDKARPGVVYKGPASAQNLADVTVQNLRTHLLLVFDNQFNAQNFSAKDGYFPYTKYPSIPNLGLAFCGKYSGGLGKSFAVGKENKGNWSPEGAVELANAACQEHKTHAGGRHLLWIYWQETGGNVRENTTARRGMHNRLGQFLSDIRTPSNKLPLPNVIGHDFVNKNTCREIAKMNPDLRNTNIG